MAAGEALTTAVAAVRRRPSSPPGAPNPLRDIDTVGSYRSWLVALGLQDVTVEPVPHQVPLTAENAWLVVLGSGFRGMLLDLDPGEVEQVRRAYLAELERRGAVELDATSLVGLGTWPGGA